MNKLISFKTFSRYCGSRGRAYDASKCELANYSICGMTERSRCSETKCPVWKRLKIGYRCERTGQHG